MNSYTVTQVGDNVRTWPQDGDAKLKFYRVTLRNQAGNELGNVELRRPANGPVPKVGDEVQGDVDRKAQYGPKLNEPKKFGGGGGFRSKPPEERRSIAMQHAQKCAVTILQLAAEPVDTENATQRVTTVAEVLFAQVMAAEKAA